MRNPFNLFKKKNPKPAPVNEIEVVTNDPGMLFVHFLFKEPFNLQRDELTTELKKQFNQVERPDADSDALILHFFPDYKIELEDAHLPAQGGIFKSDKVQINQDDFQSALQQNWSWKEGAEIIKQCKFEFMASDFMSTVFDYKQRAEFHQKFIASIIHVTKPDALYFKQSDKLISPDQYLAQISDYPENNLYGLLNVRMFKVENDSKNTMIMDSLGLHSLGLPDFQIQFTNEDPSEIAGSIYNYASYVFENGAVIEENDTIGENRWRCNYQTSLIGPSRTVINVSI